MTTDDSSDNEIIEQVRRGLALKNIAPSGIKIRRFPGEVIVVVEVDEARFEQAVSLASELDGLVPNGFVTVRKSDKGDQQPDSPSRISSLSDAKVNTLIELLNERSRTSEHQPSLRYVKDAAQTVNIVASRRHHLLFGRRGVGKTALMLEAKRVVEERGATTFWINVQTIRSLSADDAFLTTCRRLCDLPSLVHAGRSKRPSSVVRAESLRDRIQSALNESSKRLVVNKLVPEIQEMLGALTQETQDSLYLFLDDFHYLTVKEQPRLLDLVLAVTRDNPVWIKASAIRHQARWFTDNPPTGLQTGHDAALINLDITLEQPAKARSFLTSILRTYSEEARLSRVTDAISAAALDRLVLASGGVPRDFLVLSGKSIEVARQRAKAKTVGVQDVNEAAGQISKIKIQELEDDAASSAGRAEARRNALNTIRKFLLEERRVTYFRVDFQDKEQHPDEYDKLQGLMDLRLIHLIHGGISDEREAGRRSEVYMLDLSQFSGMRFQRNLRVLDLAGDHLVLKGTGGPAASRKGDSSKRLLSILRRGPVFALNDLASEQSP